MGHFVGSRSLRLATLASARCSCRSSIESSRPVRARKFPRLCRLRVRCARRRFVVAITPARRPCPLSPPPVPPPLRSLRSLPGGGCNAPSLFWLRSARVAGGGSVRPLLPAQSPAHPCRKVASPRPPRFAAQSPRKKVAPRSGAPRPPSSLF